MGLVLAFSGNTVTRMLPVFADTDPATLTMEPATIESRITERTRAIMPVHIFGMPCDMDAINAIAKKHKLAVIEERLADLDRMRRLLKTLISECSAGKRPRSCPIIATLSAGA